MAEREHIASKDCWCQPVTVEDYRESCMDEQADVQSSRFRPRYRSLSPAEQAQLDELKTVFANVEALVDRLPPGRDKSLAFTKLEESCMWAVKALTA